MGSNETKTVTNEPKIPPKPDDWTDYDWNKLFAKEEKKINTENKMSVSVFNSKKQQKESWEINDATIYTQNDEFDYRELDPIGYIGKEESDEDIQSDVYEMSD